MTYDRFILKTKMSFLLWGRFSTFLNFWCFSHIFLRMSKMQWIHTGAQLIIDRTFDMHNLNPITPNNMPSMFFHSCDFISRDIFSWSSKTSKTSGSWSTKFKWHVQSKNYQSKIIMQIMPSSYYSIPSSKFFGNFLGTLNFSYPKTQ